MNDDNIIHLYNIRSDDAIQQTQDKYSHYCYTIARNILSSNEDVEECVNDTYLRVWNSIPPQHPRSLSSYIGRIIRNLSIDRYRENISQKRGGGNIDLILSELTDSIPICNSAEQEYEASELGRTISTFLNSIDQEDRIIFVRRYWFADKVCDIANDYSYTQSKVKSMLLRTRKKLKTYLESEGVVL